MVGDTLADMQCARAASVTAIAVSYGYSDLSVFELGADTVIDDFVELASVLRVWVTSTVNKRFDPFYLRLERSEWLDTLTMYGLFLRSSELVEGWNDWNHGTILKRLNGLNYLNGLRQLIN
jgi:hypothetical protein